MKKQVSSSTLVALARIENDAEDLSLVEECCRKGSARATSSRCVQGTRVLTRIRDRLQAALSRCVSKRGIKFVARPTGAAGEQDSPEVVQRVRAGFPMVDQIVRSLAPWLGRSLDVDDLIACGRVGLLSAARRFDANLGDSFEAYASYRVRGAIMDAARPYMMISRSGRSRLRAANAVPRFEERMARNELATQFQDTRMHKVQNLAETLAAMSATVPLGVVLEVPSEEDNDLFGFDDTDPEQLFSNAQLSTFLRRIVRTLPSEEAEIIRRYYFRDEQLDAIAEGLELSASWVSRLQKQAIERLRKRVKPLSAELRARGVHAIANST